MTGPERQTLDVLLRMLESQDRTLEAIARDVREIGERVSKVELNRAAEAGTAAGFAAAAATSEAHKNQRTTSLRAWVAIGAAFLVGLLNFLFNVFQGLRGI